MSSWNAASHCSNELKLFRLNSLLVSSGDRVEISKITFGRGERNRLRFDDLPNRHRVRGAHADERAHHSGEIRVKRSLQKRATPHFAPQASIGANSLHRGADRVARHTVFAREVTLVGKPKAFTPLPGLDPPAQRRFDVARHALGHASPNTRPFLSQLSCCQRNAKGQGRLDAMAKHSAAEKDRRGMRPVGSGDNHGSAAEAPTRAAFLCNATIPGEERKREACVLNQRTLYWTKIGRRGRMKVATYRIAGERRVGIVDERQENGVRVRPLARRSRMRRTRSCRARPFASLSVADIDERGRA